MLLTLTSTGEQATDLGYLLHKHPDRVQTFQLSVGAAHVYYPEATDERCTAALLLEVDPVGLVRARKAAGDGSALAHYVNDRPYAASSLLAVALGRVFGSALKGRCDARPDLVAAPLRLTLRLPAVPAPQLHRRLFEPLGWQVGSTVAPLDPHVPRWGDAPYADLTLTGTMPLQQALSHLYVMLPVLDDAKHYWVGSDEVDKLVRTAGSWLGQHPERELITRRYLRHQRRFVADATERLAALDDTLAALDDTVVPGDDAIDPPDDTGVPVDDTGAPVDEPAPRRPLVAHRVAAVLQALRDVGARRVVDLGCGEGVLLRELVADPAFTEILGVDVSARELARAERRLDLDRMPDSKRARLNLRQSSLTYRDRSIEGFDAAVLMEVVEHVDPDRLPALEANVFAHARPGAVVVTTPNADYNPRYQGLAPGAMRHPDHRFEWSRAEFTRWAERVAAESGYGVQLRPVGDVDADLGPATQLALFTRGGDR